MLEVKDHPLVSVLIPAYNKGRFIAQTVESVLGQTYPHVEVLVVDDGSTDNTAELLAPYRDRIAYVKKAHGNFVGPGSAINVGIPRTKGELIHCLDADDLVEPDYYARVVDVFADHPGVGVVSTDATVIDEAGEVLTQYTRRPFKNRYEGMLEGLYHSPVGGSFMTVRRRCYDRIGLRRPEYEIADDYDMFLRIIEREDPFHISRFLFRWRWCREGISRNTEKTNALSRAVTRDFVRRHSVEDFFPSLKTRNDPFLRAVATVHVTQSLMHQRLYEDALSWLEQAIQIRGVTPVLAAVKADIQRRLRNGQTPENASNGESLHPTYGATRMDGAIQVIRPALEKIRVWMELLVSSDPTRVAIVGAGTTAEMVYLCASKLPMEVMAVADENPHAWGTPFMRGLAVSSPAVLDTLSVDCVIVARSLNPHAAIEKLKPLEQRGIKVASVHEVFDLFP